MDLQKKIISDNGGEFSNAEMNTFAEAFSIKLIHTAAESPWSNGTVERLNGVLGKLVLKILDDVKCDTDIALAWAVAARNAYYNNSGYSPNQLVFGFNPSMPNIYNSKPPGLKKVSTSEMIAKMTEAKRVAMEAFVKFDSCEKLKRALSSNVRRTVIDDLKVGDEVYYKRDRSEEWYGPAKVILVEGKVITVRHGGVTIKVNTVSLVKIPHICTPECETKESENKNNETVGSESERSDQQKQWDRNRSTTPKAVHSGILEPRVLDKDTDSDRYHKGAKVGTHRKGHQNMPIKPPSNVRVNERVAELDYYETDGVAETIDGNGMGCTSEKRKDRKDGTGSRKKQRNTDSNPTINWRSGERFQGIDSVTGEYVSGKILSKVEGINNNLYNIESDQDGYRGWFDMSEIKDLSLVREETEMLVLYNNSQIAEAKEKEIKNWVQNDVFETVENTGQKYITVRWVITEKIKDGKLVTKARLVARGFEENTENLQKDSPTCSREAIRMLITIASTMRWDCHTIDVKSAYLQGDNIQRKIFLKPPKEYDEGKLWRLKKTVYGLCDAARAWYFRVKNELKSLSVKICPIDNSLFSWNKDGKLEGIICIYVDDFLWAGTENFYKKVIEKLKKKFLIGSSESIAFTYVGLSIRSYRDGITVDQIQYIAGLAQIPISKKRASEKNVNLDGKEKKEYRALVGQLNWVATHTRPDISFETCALSSSFYDAKVADLLRLNKLVERVKRESINLYFPRLECITKCTLECYTDASLQNLPNSNSQGGLLIFLQDTAGKRCPILWKSKKLERKVKLTIAAETLALLEGAEYSVYLAHILKQLIEGMEVKIQCYTDNKSIVEALQSTKKLSSPMLNIDTLILREFLEKGEIEPIKWVKGEKQLADPLTKLGVCTEKLKNDLSRD